MSLLYKMEHRKETTLISLTKNNHLTSHFFFFHYQTGSQSFVNSFRISMYGSNVEFHPFYKIKQSQYFSVCDRHRIEKIKSSSCSFESCNAVQRIVWFCKLNSSSQLRQDEQTVFWILNTSPFPLWTRIAARKHRRRTSDCTQNRPMRRFLYGKWDESD